MTHDELIKKCEAFIDQTEEPTGKRLADWIASEVQGGVTIDDVYTMFRRVPQIDEWAKQVTTWHPAAQEVFFHFVYKCIVYESVVFPDARNTHSVDFCRKILSMTNGQTFWDF